MQHYSRPLAPAEAVLCFLMSETKSPKGLENIIQKGSENTKITTLYIDVWEDVCEDCCKS